MKIRALYLYFIFALWVFGLMLLNRFAHFNGTGLGITLTFLTMVVAPGIFIYRLLKLKSGLAVLWGIGLGFVLYFLINLVAIFGGLSINQVVLFSGIIFGFLYIFALIKDRNDFIEWEIAKKDYLFWAVIIVGAIFAFLGVDAQSDKLLGDGWFHLAILEKIVSGLPLTSANLWVTKTETLNPVYSFPVWHILVGAFSKLMDIPIYTAFRQVILPLAILSFIVWTGFLSAVFKNRYLVLTGMLAFFLIMLKDNFFYYLVPMASPDTLNRLLLLPLALAMIIEFLYQEKLSRVKLAIIILVTILLGLIHFTQIIYLVLGLFIFLVIILIFDRQKELIKRLGYIFGGFAVLLLPYLLIVQRDFVGNFFSANAANYLSTGDIFAYKTPGELNVVYRYAVLTLPFIVLFWQKNKRLMLIFSSTILSLLISWQALGLREVFLKYFGEILVERAIANIPNFLFFGFILFWIVWAISRLLKRFNQQAVVIVLVFLSLTLFFPAVRNFTSEMVLKLIFNDQLALFNGYFWLVLAILGVAAVLIYVLKKKRSLPEDAPYPSFIVIAVFLSLFLASPYFSGFSKVLANSPNGSMYSQRIINNASDINLIGGEKTIAFLNSVPFGSVFITENVSIAQNILLYSPNYAAEYPYSISQFGPSLGFFDNSQNLEERLKVLNDLAVDYIFIRRNEDRQFVASYPEYFQPVFENNFNYPVTQAGETNLIPVQYSVYKYLK